MKKIILFILMLATIFTLGACKKKEPTPRVMDNFLSDFTLTENAFEDYDKISKNEKGSNKLSYLHKAFSSSINAKNKTIINKISFTVYNCSETDYSFYVLDPSEATVYKSNKIYMMDVNFDTARRIEIKNGEEYTMTYDLGLTMKKGYSLQIFFGFDTTDTGGVKTMIENAGVYNFKVDYSVYL